MPGTQTTRFSGEVNNNNDYISTTASLLNLPPEIRVMIYSYFPNDAGTITIFSDWVFSRNIDSRSLILLHINRLIRSEVEDIFYAKQEFSFRSVPAARKFIEGIGDRRAGLIKKIQFEAWFCDRFASILGQGFMPTLQKLQNLERVIFREPRVRIATNTRKRKPVTEEGREFLVRVPHRQPLKAQTSEGVYTDYELGPSSYIVMAIWEQFTDGHVTCYEFPRHYGFENERTHALVFTTPGKVQSETLLSDDLARSCTHFLEYVPYSVPLSDRDTLRLRAAKYASDADWVEAAETKAKFRKVQNEKARERAKVRAKQRAEERARYKALGFHLTRRLGDWGETDSEDSEVSFEW